MPTNQIIKIDQSNNIRLIDPEEENLPTTEEVSISPEKKKNNEITICFVGTEKSWDRNKNIIDDIFHSLFLLILQMMMGIMI